MIDSNAFETSSAVTVAFVYIAPYVVPYVTYNSTFPFSTVPKSDVAVVEPFPAVESLRSSVTLYLFTLHSAVNVSSPALNVYVVPSKIPLKPSLFVQPVNV